MSDVHPAGKVRYVTNGGSSRAYLFVRADVSPTKSLNRGICVYMLHMLYTLHMSYVLISNSLLWTRVGLGVPHGDREVRLRETLRDVNPVLCISIVINISIIISIVLVLVNANTVLVNISISISVVASMIMINVVITTCMIMNHNMLLLAILSHT